MAIESLEDNGLLWLGMAEYGPLAHCVKMLEDRINTMRHVFCSWHVFLKNANPNDLGSYSCFIIFDPTLLTKKLLTILTSC